MQDKKQKWLMVANWKMNPVSLKLAKQTFAGIKKTASKTKNTQTVICPPFIYLEALKTSGHRCALGAQNLSHESEGAHTGEVSYLALKNLGLKYCIIGHSERRAMGETDEDINQKVKASLRGMMVPIICVGEQERDASGQYLSFLKNQLETAVRGLPKSSIKDIVVAYEPIWAIGKNAKAPATPREVFEISIFIKKILSDLYGMKSVPPTKILYGGSVDLANISYFAEEALVDGFLVGRASLDKEVFSQMIIKIDGIKR